MKGKTRAPTKRQSHVCRKKRIWKCTFTCLDCLNCSERSHNGISPCLMSFYHIKDAFVENVMRIATLESQLFFYLFLRMRTLRLRERSYHAWPRLRSCIEWAEPGQKQGVVGQAGSSMCWPLHFQTLVIVKVQMRACKRARLMRCFQ